ncbi:MAG TPA: plastocyanin/azurin family copper-binding protein [Solirubrobacteraceae bacterium]|jgi:plastocyanin|nr:plastocyanin/azurin family copper-binding protein [Solirubrobacteraceae bacterium]
MTARPPALIACAALAALAGCGSSGSSSSASSSSGSSAASTRASAQRSSGEATGGLKVAAKPKFATASGPVHSGAVPIAYRNIAIAPDTVRVKVGSTIEWTNYDNVEHNVTSEGGPQRFASNNFGERGTFQVKTLKPGVIHYECTIHPASMNGTIEVVK